MRGFFVEVGVAAVLGLMLASALRTEPDPGRHADARPTAEAIAALRVVVVEEPRIEPAAVLVGPVQAPAEEEGGAAPDMAQLPDPGFPYPAARIERAI